jgi:hypothetical protein
MGRDDMGQIGRGWHDLEFDGERGCRWSHEQAVFFLRASGGRAVRMEICCHHPDLASEPVAVTLVVNGLPAGERLMDRYGWQEVSFETDPAQAGPTLECALGVSRTWRPGDAGGGDRRSLGARVHRIWQS